MPIYPKLVRKSTSNETTGEDGGGGGGGGGSKSKPSSVSSSRTTPAGVKLKSASVESHNVPNIICSSINLYDADADLELDPYAEEAYLTARAAAAGAESSTSWFSGVMGEGAPVQRGVSAEANPCRAQSRTISQDSLDSSASATGSTADKTSPKSTNKSNKSSFRHRNFLAPFGSHFGAPLRPSVSTSCLFSGCNDDTLTVAPQVSKSKSSKAKGKPSADPAPGDGYLMAGVTDADAPSDTSTASGSSGGAGAMVSNTSLVCVPTRASLTHEWRKLKTPNKCRECNLLVYFNGRECSWCGFVAHKKCIMVLVIKCSIQLVREQQKQQQQQQQQQQQSLLQPAASLDRRDHLGLGLFNRSHSNIQQLASVKARSDKRSLLSSTTAQSIGHHHHPYHHQHYQVRPIFGQPIAEANGERMLDVVNRFVYEMDTRGLTSKGIYRVSSIKSKVDKLCHYYDHNHSSLIDLSSFHPNIIANALKMYLRRLPEPLLTRQLYVQFIELAKKYSSSPLGAAATHQYQLAPAMQPTTAPTITTSSTSTESICAVDGPLITRNSNDNNNNLYIASHLHRSMIAMPTTTTSVIADQHCQQLDTEYELNMIKDIQKVVDQLPHLNRSIAASILRHLRRVADLAPENQMSAKNLSIIFGPTLLSTADNKSLAIVDNIHQARVIELMITWAYQIFPLPQQPIH